MSQSNDRKKKEEDPVQKSFRADVRKIKAEAAKLKLAKMTKEWNYGRLPKSQMRISPNKPLPRACSSLIRKYLSPTWIPKECKLEFCTMSKGENNCCYIPQHYAFGSSLNIKTLIANAFNFNRLQPEHQSITTEAMMNKLIAEETQNFHLEVIINNEYCLKCYIKAAGPSAREKATNIAQVLFVYVLR